MREKKRILAFLTVLIMIFNMFSPYTALVVQAAATGTLESDALVFQNMGVTTKSNGKKILRVQLAMSSNEILTGMDISFKFDTTRLQPCNKNTGAALSTLNNFSAVQNTYYLGSIQSKSYTVDSSSNKGEINIITTEEEIDILDPDANGIGVEYQGAVMGDPDYDTGAAQFPDRGYYPIMDFYFVILDDDIDTDSIPSDLFSLSPQGASAPTGCRVAYLSSNGIETKKDIASINYGGFAQTSTKTVTGISVKTNPTNTSYEHGDTIDLTGGELTVTYSDGTQEDISMTDAGVSISIPSDGKAYVSNQVVTVSYEGKNTTFNITVTDPIDTLTITSPMSTTEYEHGDNIDFTGLQLLVKRKSGATESLTQSSEGVTTSEITADVNSSTFVQSSPEGATPVRGTQKISFTYEGKTADATIIVNDTITGIDLISQPTKTVYKRGENVDLSGAKVKVSLGSGATQEIALPDGSVTVGGYNNTSTGSKQNLSVTFGSFTATDTIDVEFYNYITNATLTQPTDVNPNYNTSLNLAGGKFNLTWQDGTVTTVNLTDSAVVVTGYSATTLTKQTVTATYTTNYVLSDGTQIPEIITKTFQVEVYNNIEDIAITAPSKTTYNHGDSLELTGGKIELTYADGTTGTLPITSATITDNGNTTINMTPAVSDYGSDYTLTKTLTITYTEDGKTGTVNYPITIVNDVKSISMHTTPKTSYNVNETLDVTSGEILVTRATGTPTVESITEGMVSGFISTVENNNLPLTVTYTENGISQTTTYNVSVVDSVTSIKIQNAPTTAKYGEEIDLTGVQILVKKGSNPTGTLINVTGGMLSGYDKNTLGEQTITVSYGGQTETFKVTVKDYVTKIEVNPASVTGKYDEELSKIITDNSIEYIVTYAKAGAQTPVALPVAKVSGYDKETTSTQNLTVTYEDKDVNSYTKGETFTAMLEVTLVDNVNSISITGTPTTVKYGEELDLSSAVIKAQKDSGEKTINISDVTITGFDKNILGEQTVTVGYGGQTTTFTVNIKDYVTGITVNSSPVTGTYGTTLSDLIANNNITYTVIYAKDGAQTPIALTDSMVVGYNDKTTNTQNLIVTYEDNDANSYTKGQTFTTNLVVTLVDNINSISITGTPSIVQYGESLDLNGATITVIRDSGSSTVNISECTVTGYDPNKLGTQTITVSYGGKSDTFEIKVEDYIDHITIKSPDKLLYGLNESLDVTGGTVSVIMASGAVKETVSMTNAMISGFDSATTGTKTLTVTYEGKTATFGITVQDLLSDMIIHTLPDKLDYLYGESMDLNGGSIQITRESGDTEVIPMNPSMITGFTTTKLGTVVVTVTYEGIERQFSINVADYEIGATLVVPDKTTYEYGEGLDLTGGLLKIQMASGAIKESVELTDTMVSGFDNKLIGKQKLTVKYKGYTKTFNVTVKDSIGGIALNSEPYKTQYKYGEKIDLIGGTIKVIKTSGTTIVEITKDMISGYNSKNSGYQVIKVKYEGFETEFVVYVYPKVAPSTEDNDKTTNDTKDEKKDNVKENKTEDKNSKKPTVIVNNNNTNNKTDVEETPSETSDIEEIDKIEEDTEVKETEEKPTETLGVKDEKQNTKEDIEDTIIASAIGLVGLLFLILLLIFKRNVNVYVIEDEEERFVLGGKDRLTKRNTKLDIDQYLDGDTYPNKVKICIDKSISKKLDGVEIEIKHRGKTIKHKVVYKNEEYEFILD